MEQTILHKVGILDHITKTMEGTLHPDLLKDNLPGYATIYDEHGDVSLVSCQDELQGTEFHLHQLFFHWPLTLAQCS